ncbi:cytidylyltransferase domain-containing protein [Polaribacter sp. Asnod1-A03]|uniref:acylneuraminate cytidylyltransferase family protein n=1 Tax=Polaribacter sp. Asnod1-A03 TaxID=3160581 RepID=UPI003869F366
MTVFLPCRAGSQRIPNKNTKEFAGVEGGLLQVKLESLTKASLVDKIVVSTNDQKVIDIAESMNHKKIVIDVRPDHLAQSSTSTDDVVDYVPTIIEDEHILWTHVTSPFITSDSINRGIKKYYENLDQGFDSLMTVNKIQTFLWGENGQAYNYDRAVEKWPRTQTLPPLYELNSGFFISSRTNYIELKDRIGVKPFLLQSEGYEKIDVDWPDDFLLAEMVYKLKYKLDDN